ncbi:MAG: SDR family NAD(P)-dependent oxidoreductase [Pseudomonadota bacterium]
MTDPDQTKVALVIGAGDHTGAAITRRFAREGYTAIPVRRQADKAHALADELSQEGLKAIGIGCDARNEEDVVELVDRIEDEVGAIEVAVFNIGANVPAPILEQSARRYRKIWEMACYAGFLTGREAARVMVPRERGTILFTGATASIRGSAGFAAFAAAKAGLRITAQSMARELGPKGIHVGHIVIDGPIDTAFIRETFPEAYARKEHDGILDPDAIAEAYWQLHIQHRSAWTFELDLRPWTEKW